MKIILAGNANTGKTTIFNKLTKSSEHVGNWLGVTTNVKEKCLIRDKHYVVADLPGIYSLSPRTEDEKNAIRYLLSNGNGEVINCVDAFNIKRNLYLTLELIEAGFNVSLCFNFLKKFKKRGTINLNKLCSKLGVSYFGEKKLDIKSLNLATVKKEFSYLDNLPLKEIKKVVAKNLEGTSVNETLVLIKLAEESEFYFDLLGVSELQKVELKKILKNKNFKASLSKARYEFIDELLADCYSVYNNEIYGYNRKIDSIVLNKYLALPIFTAVMFFVFWLTFGMFGQWFTGCFNLVLDKLIFSPLLTALSYAPPFVYGLLGNGVIGGLSVVLGFMPQVVLLYLCLNVLESTGYISRLAFIFDDFFSKVGLDGKSVFTLLLGFGCATSAVATSKTIASDNARKKTAIVTSLLPCTAKLPVFGLIAGMFFVKYKFLLVFSLYFLAIILVILFSAVMNRGKLKTQKEAKIIEFPSYKMISFGGAVREVIKASVQFLTRIASVVVVANVFIYLLSSYTITLQQATSGKLSIIEWLARLLVPIFKPIGITNCYLIIALIVGVMAKELIVSTIGLYLGLSGVAVSGGVLGLSTAGAISFAVFSAFYLPCLSTISVLKQEVGIKLTFKSCLGMLFASYVLSLLVYQTLIGNHFVLVGFILGFVILASVNKVCQKNSKWRCRSCKKCC